MNEVFKILNEPLILTILTLSIGSYLLSRLGERRAKKDNIREKAIQLLEEVGTDVNLVLSSIYGRIRTQEFEIKPDSFIDEKRKALFNKRFSVRIRSSVYLKSEEFWKEYEVITFEIDKIVSFLDTLSRNYRLDSIAKEIQGIKQRLAKNWSVDVPPANPKYNPPSDELAAWTKMVWNRAVWLLTKHLREVVR